MFAANFGLTARNVIGHLLVSRLARTAMLAAALATGCATALPRADGSKAPSHAGYPGPIIDAHAHVLISDDPFALNPRVRADEATLATEMRRAGVVRAGMVTMAKRGDLDGTRQANDRLLAIAEASQGTLFAICSVHPDDGPAALAEMERVAARGARVLKLHPNTQQFDVASAAVAAVVAKAADLNMIILFDGYSPLDANQLGKFVALAVTNPRARLIIAHMAGPRFAELAMLVATLRLYSWYANNLWADVSASSVMYADSPLAAQYAWAVRKFGTDRVLFGSDFPMGMPSETAEAVRQLGFSGAEQKAIFFDNAEALFGPATPSPIAGGSAAR